MCKRLKTIVIGVLMSSIILTTLGNNNHIFADSSVSRQLLIGDYIFFGHYFGDPILWRVVSFDQKGHPILYSEEILCYKAFDSADSGIYNGEIYNENPNATATDIANALGSSRWRDSTIRAWLNSDQSQVDYLFSPPKAKALSKTDYAYDREAGFLSHFNQMDCSAIVPIDHKTLLINNSEVYDDIDGGTLCNDMDLTYGTLTYGNYDDIRYEHVTDKVFLLSSKEFTNWIVNKGWKSTAKQSKAINKIKPHKKEFALWLRTASGRPDNPMCVYADLKGDYYDNYNDYTASEADFGVRPALCINDEMIIIVSGTGDRKMPFKIEVKPLSEVKEAAHNTDGYITREALCGLIIDLYERLSFVLAPPIGTNPFIDTANESVIKAYYLDLITDEGEGYFEPSRAITQQEIQEMMNRLLKKVYKNQKIDGGYTETLDSQSYILRENAEILMRHIYRTIKSQIGGNFIVNILGHKGELLEQDIVIIDHHIYLPAEEVITKLGGKTNGIESNENDGTYFVMEMMDKNKKAMSVYTAPNWNQLITNRNAKELPWMTLERPPVIIDNIYMVPIEVFERGFKLEIEIDLEKRVITVDHK